MGRRGFKVKRSGYRLYKKKKSKAAQAAAIILTILAAAALLIVGYSLGKPLVDYLTGNDNRDSTVSYWAPTVEASTEEAEQTTAATTTTPPETTPPAKPVSEGTAAIIEGDALLSVQSAQEAITKAKADGFTSIVCVLKDETGILWYKTANEDVKGSDIVKGGLSATQLASMISSAGMTPAAKLSTLKDHSAQPYIDGATYRFADGSSNWIDGRPENGGKPWLSPFNKASADYVSSLVGEIAKSGFKTIILANVEYPDFRQYDFTVLADIDSASKRANALNDVITACEKAAESNGASVSIEISAAELIDNDDLSSTTAEPLKLGSKLSQSIGIVLNYDNAELAEVTAIELADSFEARFRQVTSEAVKKLGDRTVTTYCTAQMLTDKQLEAIQMTSAEVGFTGLIIPIS